MIPVCGGGVRGWGIRLLHRKAVLCQCVLVHAQLQNLGGHAGFSSLQVSLKRKDGGGYYAREHEVGAGMSNILEHRGGSRNHSTCCGDCTVMVVVVVVALW